MKFKSESLLHELKTQTNQHISVAKSFLELSEEQLNTRKFKDSWNVLECFKHLVNYANYYYPLIYKLIDKSTTKPKVIFSPGILGNYFANAMLPGISMKKMNSPQDKNPLGENLSKIVIEDFLKQQKLLLQILEKSENVNLEKVRIPISISRLIRLKLGDTLRFVIYHNERHLLQAQNVLKHA